MKVRNQHVILKRNATVNVIKKLLREGKVVGNRRVQFANEKQAFFFVLNKDTDNNSGFKFNSKNPYDLYRKHKQRYKL